METTNFTSTLKFYYFMKHLDSLINLFSSLPCNCIIVPFALILGAYWDIRNLAVNKNNKKLCQESMKKNSNVLNKLWFFDYNCYLTVCNEK